MPAAVIVIQVRYLSKKAFSIMAQAGLDQRLFYAAEIAADGLPSKSAAFE